MNSTSTLLLTASADTSVRLWDVQTGKTLFVFKHLAPVRGVEFAEGDRQFLTVGDKSLGQEAAIFIYDLAEDLSQRMLHVRSITGFDSMQTRQRSPTAGP